MDVLKLSSVWAKDELFSTPFFILGGAVFMIMSLGFWQLGKTEMARAFIVPSLVAGVLLSIIGAGLFYTNKVRISQFEVDFMADSQAFIDAELQRCTDTLKEYKIVVFTAIPLIIAVCALILCLVDLPIWRASMITAIGMLVIILFIDGSAKSRIESYQAQLLLAKEKQVKL